MGISVDLGKERLHGYLPRFVLISFLFMPILAVFSPLFRWFNLYYLDQVVVFVVVMIYSIFKINRLQLISWMEWYLLIILLAYILPLLFPDQKVFRWYKRKFYLFLNFYIFSRFAFFALFLCTVCLYYKYFEALFLSAMILTLILISRDAKSRKTKFLKVFSLILFIVVLSRIFYCLANTPNRYTCLFTYATVAVLAFYFVFIVWKKRVLIARSPKHSSLWILYFILFCMMTSLLILPEFLYAYAVSKQSQPKQHWLEKRMRDYYDLVVLDAGDRFFATPFSKGIGLFTKEDHEYASMIRNVGEKNAQRFVYDKINSLIYLANYTPKFSKAEMTETPDISVYDTELNEIGAINCEQCYWAIYVQMSQKFNALYFSCEFSGDIIRYDIEENKAISMGKMFFPNVIRLSQDENYLYAAPLAGSKMAKFNAATGDLEKINGTTPAILGMIHDKEKKRLYTARFALGEIGILDADTLEWIGTIASGFGSRDMDFDPERQLLFTGNYFSGTLSIHDLKNNRVYDVYAGPRIRGVYYEPEDNRIYFCTKYGVGYYSLLDTVYDNYPSRNELRKKTWDAIRLSKNDFREFFSFLKDFQTFLVRKQ